MEETIQPQTKILQKYAIPILIAVIVFFLIFIALVISLLSNNNTNSQNNNEMLNETPTQVVSQPNTEETLLLLIPNNTCADELRFGNPSYAYIGSQRYSFTEEQKMWIEANCPNVKRNVSTAQVTTVDGVAWSYDMPNWIAPANAPACVDPLEFLSPADLSQATSILYPGQTRGSDYKTHGALRFDNTLDNSVSVKMPADAYLWAAAKYDEGGEVQYLIQFISKCGIVFKFDHLLTLVPKLSDVANLPTAKSTGEGITYSNPTLLFKAGEEIATEVGFRNNHNVGFDFGVSDLRQKNEISLRDPSYVTAHMDDAESASNAICWLDYLEGENKALAKSLPVIAVDATAESDYCN